MDAVEPEFYGASDVIRNTYQPASAARTSPVVSLMAGYQPIVAPKACMVCTILSATMMIAAKRMQLRGNALKGALYPISSSIVMLVGTLGLLLSVTSLLTCGLRSLQLDAAHALKRT